jgi:hypothetical protein
MKFVRQLAVALVIAGAYGCADTLEVANPNNPDRERTLANPSDVESLASNQFQQIVAGTHDGTARIQTGMMTASFMSASTLANNAMGPRSSIPRQQIDNSVGNAYQGDNFAEYQRFSFVARNAVDVLDRATRDDFTLGPGRDGDLIRLKAWTYFVYGLALGYLSLGYDSAGVPRTNEPDQFVPPLEGYREINQWALAQLDSALAYARLPNATALPGGWLSGFGGPSTSVALFQQAIRSYAAVIRAGVARDPAERAAVDWDRVIADATNGITSNLMVTMNPSNGWDYEWLTTTLHFRDANWHQAPYYIIGMADVSGAFDNWLATPRATRQPFVIVTTDKRFPQGATRAAQNRAAADDDKPLPAGQYYRNRNSGKDQAAVGWETSWYDHYRFRAFADASRIGEFPLLTQAEIDMLAAEGYIRKNNFAAAAALIDRTRTAAGLPALTGVVTSATQPVPGGAECVPRVPLGTGPTQCGTIMEAMKWEKRMETAFTSWGAWFFDARGWGDLPIGTAVHWPVPSQDLNARNMPIYNMGGAGGPGAATESTYGYGVGNR